MARTTPNVISTNNLKTVTPAKAGAHTTYDQRRHKAKVL
jgi:hypothetical protein